MTFCFPKSKPSTEIWYQCLLGIVHQWLCQIKYNPWLNIRWGLSDGEGCEQIWSSLAWLVSPLHYASKQSIGWMFASKS
ncbi:hypothetical protein CROQUDRAFT_52538 [Cronartium quercuum f. sp. fusiforme G11]|uniref:Uncharacterized protein n=1 Tax=Cronartium quercuum f. sp. fusiforme G11 TaxID=708437 RepID=A0A9P6NAZ5_9BASI|nr:hypothetical protein CROQUDRAFT_52538 [Cronartium quercuum f. sp. fusiforme G11]